MRLGITVEALSPELTGIGRYAWELCRGLEGCPAVEDLAFSRGNRWSSDLEQLMPGRPYATRDRIKAWRKLRFRRYLRRRLIHATNYFLPDEAETGIITVHDLSVLLYPDSHPPERVKAFEEKLPSSIARASHVITDSEYIRREVISMLGIPAGKVTAVHLGASDAFRPICRQQRTPVLREMLGDVADGYILALATFEPRKRIDVAIRAHAHLCDTGRTSLPLVLAGASGWGDEGLQALITRETQKGNLRMLGHVPEERLPYLYAGARLFLYLSSYEGFGLPPIEAMRCGTPTMVADRACLPEVTGGAAMLVDPDDIDLVSEQMEQALDDEQWRSGAIRDGLTVAQGLSWSRCVDRTLSLYKQNWIIS